MIPCDTTSDLSHYLHGQYFEEVQFSLKYNGIRDPYQSDYLNDDGGHPGPEPSCGSTDVLEGGGISSKIWKRPRPAQTYLPS